MDTIEKNKKMSRKEFIIKLGIGLGAISGFLIIDDSFNIIHPGVNRSKNLPSKPLLKEDIICFNDDNYLILKRDNGSNKNQCAVNNVGAEIVKYLDGDNTVEDILSKIANKFPIPLSEAMQAKIAYFISILSMMDFLTEPFYVNIIENYEA